VDSFIEFFQLPIHSRTYIEPDPITLGSDDEVTSAFCEKIQIRSNIVVGIEEKSPLSLRIRKNSLDHPLPYEVLGIFSEILTLQNDGDSPNGRSVKEVSVHDGSGRTVTHLRESFHYLGRGLRYIHLVHADEIGVGNLSDECEASLLDPSGKIREALFLEKVFISICGLLHFSMRTIAEFTEEYGLLSENGGEEVFEKMLIPYSHSSKEVLILPTHEI